MGFRQLLSNFLDRIRLLTDTRGFGFNRPRHGYVIIILCVFIPLIFWATKWCLDRITLDKLKINIGLGDDSDNKQEVIGSDPFKKCAKTAALEVAKKWNPALSYKGQKESMLRIADEVYNASGSFVSTIVTSGSPLKRAIPSLDIDTKVTVKKNYGFNPIEVTYSHDDSSVPSGGSGEQESTENRTVEYEDDSGESHLGEGKNIVNISELYRRAYFLVKNPRATLDTPFCDVCSNTYYYLNGSIILRTQCVNTYVNNDASLLLDRSYCGTGNEDFSFHDSMHYLLKGSQVQAKTSDGNKKIPEHYRIRKDADDPKVQISIVDDKIKVRTDADIVEERPETVGYAVPAECNVDIVLTIPVNEAACNIDNADVNSPTAGLPTVVAQYGSTNLESTQKTPIYQIAQAYRTFLRENFEFTRGVNVGLIPYTGKVSLPPDRADISDESTCWTKLLDTLTWDYNAEPYIRQVLLYIGSPQHKYSTNATPPLGVPNVWGGAYDGRSPHALYNVMCRGKANGSYAGNKIYMADLLSTENPANYQFRRMNPYPPLVKYSSLLAKHFYVKANTSNYPLDNLTINAGIPYFIVELNPDVTKIHDLLNAVVAFDFHNNVSNFLFIPITWANNLFQSWARHDSFAAADTEEDDEGGGRLSHSSSSANRKKVLILVVNKPDWFEPDELTYIGFDNDYSEVPMIESDTIDFSVKHDASQGFAGSVTSLWGKQSGVLQFVSSDVKYNSDDTGKGYYECESGSVTLKFPTKALVKVVVAPSVKEDIKWENKDCDLSQIGSGWNNEVSMGVGPVSGQGEECMMAQSSSGQIAYSSNGENWTYLTSTGASSKVHRGGLMYGKGVWVSCSNYGTDGVDSIPRYSVDGGKTWQECEFNGNSQKWQRITSTCFAKNMFWGIAGQYGDGIVASNDGKTWEKKALRPLESEGKYNYSSNLSYINGLWIVTWVVGVGNRVYVAKYKDSLDLEWETPEFYFSEEETSDHEIGSLSGSTVHNGYLYMLKPKGTYIARTDGKFIDDNKLIFEKLSGFTCSNNHYNLTYYNGKFYTIGYAGTCCHIGTLNSEPGSIKFTNILPGNLTNTEEKSVSSRTEFYIEPNQITQTNDGCEVKIDLENIRLISAEITNRPYEIQEVEEEVEVTKIVETSATVKLEGTTDGTGEGAIVADGPFDVKVRVEGTQGSKTSKFKYIGNSFGGYEKLRALLEVNGRLFVAPMEGDYFFTSTDGEHWEKTNCKILPYDATYTPLIICYASDKYIISRYHDGSCHIQTSSDGIHWEEDIRTIGSDFPVKFFYAFEDTWINSEYDSKAMEQNTYVSTDFGKNWTTYSLPYDQYHIAFGVFDAAYKKGVLIIADCTDMLFRSHDRGETFIQCPFYGRPDGAACITVTQNKFWYAFNLSDVYCSTDGEKWDYYELEPVNGCSMWYSGRFAVWKDKFIGYVNGDIYVWQIPDELLEESPSFKIAEESYEITAPQEIIIPADKLIKSDEGTYKAPYKITKSKITSVSFVNPAEAVIKKTVTEKQKVTRKKVVFTSMRLPDMSRVVDFKNSNATGMKYNVCGEGLLNPNDYILCDPSFFIWDDDATRFNNAFKFGSFNFVGDMFIITTNEDIDTGAAKLFINKNINIDSYLGFGINRLYWSTLAEDSRLRPHSYELYIGIALFDAGDGQLVANMLGMTAPINAALYFGASGDRAHTYQWLLDGSKRVQWPSVNDGISPATLACQKVTADAADKLKADNPNLRVYVIKFRKQEQFVAKGDKESRKCSFNYDYVDACATSSKYVYEANDEAALASTLQTIAADIKEWADHKPAQNVSGPN